MIYYFYSENGGLKGLLNYKRMKISLFETRGQAVEYACGKQGEKPVGYIYSCTQLGGRYFNNAYKSEHPLQITGCEKLEDLL